VPMLNPGTYDIAVEKPGFKTLLQKSVVLLQGHVQQS
jgi:hypothetical protein